MACILQHVGQVSGLSRYGSLLKPTHCPTQEICKPTKWYAKLMEIMKGGNIELRNSIEQYHQKSKVLLAIVTSIFAGTLLLSSCATTHKSPSKPTANTIAKPSTSTMITPAVGNRYLPTLINSNTNHYMSFSCASPTFCMGSEANGDIVTYNGNTWSPPNPVTSSGGHISCVSPTFCMDVVGGNNRSEYLYNGTTWIHSSQHAIPIGGLSVSCASPHFCAGVYGTLELYNGVSWSDYFKTKSIQSVTLNRNFVLGDISCTLPRFCMILGSPAHSDSVYVTTYNGTTWSPSTVAVPGAGPTSLSASVSCTSPTFCMVVTENGYAASYNGIAWGLPKKIGPTSLSASVSCTSPTFCMVVTTTGYAVTYHG